MSCQKFTVTLSPKPKNFIASLTPPSKRFSVNLTNNPNKFSVVIRPRVVTQLVTLSPLPKRFSVSIRTGRPGPQGPPGSSGTGGGIRELLSGLKNGSNTVFTSTFPIATNTDYVTICGIPQTKPTHYIITDDNEITFDEPPLVTEILQIEYRSA